MLIIIAGAHLLMLICTISFIIPCSSKKSIGEQNCIYRQADTLADGQGDSTIPLKVHLWGIICKTKKIILSRTFLYKNHVDCLKYDASFIEKSVYLITSKTFDWYLDILLPIAHLFIFH